MTAVGSERAGPARGPSAGVDQTARTEREGRSARGGAGIPCASHPSPGPAGQPPLLYKSTRPARLRRTRESRTHAPAPPRTHRRTRARCAPPDSAQAVLGGGDCGFSRLPAALSGQTQRRVTPHLGRGGHAARVPLAEVRPGVQAKAARGAWARVCVGTGSALRAPGSSRQGPAGPGSRGGASAQQWLRPIPNGTHMLWPPI